MSRTLFSLAGFQVILIGRFWVIAEDRYSWGPGGCQIDYSYGCNSDDEWCQRYYRKLLRK